MEVRTMEQTDKNSAKGFLEKYNKETLINKGFLGKAWKVGNSLVVTIPKPMREFFNIVPQDKLEFEIKAKLNIYNFRFVATSS